MIKADEPSPLPHDAKRRFQNIFVDQATGSYLLLSFGMGAVAFLLPILLVATGGYAGHYSISWFYHVGDTPRNLLVGCLWATGVFLFLFHGLSWLENWLLNVAGIAGISVAMNPMAPVQCGTAGGGASLHFVSAGVFFLCLSIVAVGLSKGRVRAIPDAAVRRSFALAYDVAGAAMVLMPVAVLALHLAGGRGCATHFLFWIETTGIWAFALFWFVKTLEYRLLLGIRFDRVAGSD